VTRLNKILVGLLVVQIALAVVMLTRDGGEAPAQLEPLSAGIDAAKVTRVQVFAKRDKGATGEAKPGVDLVKKGEAWVVASAFDYPVDPEKVTKLLTSVSGLKSRGAIATSASRHVQLGVADQVYERKLVVTTAAGDRVYFIGASAGTQRTAVRVGGDAKVHAVPSRDLSAWSVDPEARGWVERTYLEIPKDEVVAVNVKTAKGVVEVDKTQGHWRVSVGGTPVTLAAGETVDGPGIEAMIGKLGRLELAEPADPARDASSPTATITVRQVAPATDADAGAVSAAPPERVIDVIADGERYWVRERGNARAVLVDKWALDTVVDMSRESLVKKPAPPAAAGAPAPTAPPPAIPGLPPG
jgi:hypothetical protein